MQLRDGMFTSAEKVQPRSHINHLLEVATLVAEATEGKDLDLVIAS
jgi:hypothetical protein